MQNWKVAVVASVMTLAGVVAGALVFRQPGAQAQQPPRAGGAFTVCMVARISTAMVDASSSQVLNAGPNNQVAVPSGWTPIGGGGVGTDRGAVVLCR